MEGEGRAMIAAIVRFIHSLHYKRFDYVSRDWVLSRSAVDDNQYLGF